MATIAIDYDGTITRDFDAARKALKALIDRGHRVVIWSTRNNPKQHSDHWTMMDEMKRSLDRHFVPYNEIDDGSIGKFHAQVYIDDKAIRFSDNWEEILERIY